jgi:hypothetical protein
MAKELDLSGVDEILAQKRDPAENTEKELDLSGVDDILAGDVGNAGWKGLGKDIVNAGKDASMFLTQGALGGGLDEVAGMVGGGAQKAVDKIGDMVNPANKVDADLEAQGFKINDLPGKGFLEEYYRPAQEKASDTYKKAEEASPALSTAGEIAGAVGSGIVTGNMLGIGKAAQGAKGLGDIWKNQGKLKAAGELLKRSGVNYAKGTPIMAAEGILASEGNLLGEELGSESQQQVGKDVLSNLALGGIAIPAMQGISDVAIPATKAGAKKALNYVDEATEGLQNTATGKKLKKAFKYGEDGINPTDEKLLVSTELGKDGFLKQETNRADKITDVIYNGGNELGEAIPKSLDKAAERGVMINIDDAFNNSMKDIAQDADKLQAIASNPQGRKIFDMIANGTSKSLNPVEAKDLLKNVDTYINKFSSYSNPDVATQDILKALTRFRGEFDGQLKRSVPEYANAAERFADFRKNTNETILAGDIPVEDTNIFWGKVKNKDQKLIEKIRNQMRGIDTEGVGANKTKESFENTIKGWKQFEANDANRIKSGQLPEGANSPLSMTGKQLEDEMKDVAHGVTLRNTMGSVKSPIDAFKNGAVSGALELGAGGMYHGARLAGAGKRNAASFSRKVYNMPVEKLNRAADQMINTPGLGTLGKALKQGIENGDSSKKNAALFSIMQNPNASLIFDDEPENKE